jgi:hypothetical protein
MVTVATEGGDGASDRRAAVPEQTRTDELRRIIRTADSKLSDAERISRNVVLASILEPISDKEGCTTRYADLKPSKSLEFFLVSGVNVGPAFAHLVDYVQRTQGTSGAYAFYYEAEELTGIKRQGGKINQGIVEYLIPIVAAQARFDPKFEKSPDFVLDQARVVMTETTAEDVAWLVRAKRLANQLSNFTKYQVSEHDVSTVLGYYAQEAELEQSRGNPKGVIFNLEFLNGFRGVRTAYKAMAASKAERVSDKAVDGYKALLSAYPEGQMAHGEAADLVAVALYLFISYGGDNPIAC